MTDRLLVGLALLSAGCAGSWSEPAGPDTWSVGCKRSRANCYEEAKAVCPSGFEILDGDSQSGYYVSGNVIAPVYKGEMLVRCR